METDGLDDLTTDVIKYWKKKSVKWEILGVEGYLWEAVQLDIIIYYESINNKLLSAQCKTNMDEEVPATPPPPPHPPLLFDLNIKIKTKQSMTTSNETESRFPQNRK